MLRNADERNTARRCGAINGDHGDGGRHGALPRPADGFPRVPVADDAAAAGAAHAVSRQRRRYRRHFRRRTGRRRERYYTVFRPSR